VLLLHDIDEANRLDAHAWLDGPHEPEGRVGGAVRELFLDMNEGRLRAEKEPDLDLPSTWERRHEIAAPTLVLVGEYDLRAIQRLARETAERIPGAQFELLHGTAHLPHLEGHARCLEAVREFLTAPS